MKPNKGMIKLDKKFIVFISVVLLLIMGLMGYTISAISGMKREMFEQKEQPIKEVVLDEEGNELPPEKEEIPLNQIEMYAFATDMVIPLQSVDGVTTPMLSIKIALGINSKEKDATDVIEVLKAKEIVFKDIIIDIISSKTVAYIDDQKSQMKLKEEIIERFADKLSTEAIVEVYFEKFIPVK